MPALCYFAASSFFSSYHQCGGMPQRKIKELLHPSSVASIHDSFQQFVHVPFAVQCQQEESRKSPQFPPDVTRLFQDGCSASMCQRCLRFVHSDGMRLFLTGEYAKAKTCWQKGHMDIFFDTFLSHSTIAFMNRDITGGCKASSESNKARLKVLDHNWINSCNTSPFLGGAKSHSRH